MLQAWHGWILRELDLFKAKFRGAAASLLGAGDTRGFSLGGCANSAGDGTRGAGCVWRPDCACGSYCLQSACGQRSRSGQAAVCTRAPRSRSPRALPAGVENVFYEGPLRLRLPVAMQLDRDGAFSFELPLPSPEGNLAKVRVGGCRAVGRHAPVTTECKWCERVQLDF